MQAFSLCDALRLPPNAIAYHVAVELARTRPDKHVLFTTDCSFWLDDFARAGRCTVRPAEGAVVHQRTCREEGGLQHYADVGWFDVEWSGHRFEVIRVDYTGSDGCGNSSAWIVSERREHAEALFAVVCRFNEEIDDEILVFHDGAFRKNRELFESVQRASFDSLVLAGDLKEQLRADLARFFASKALYTEHGLPWKRGVLLVGPPGNGKTQATRALVKEAARPCIYVRTLSGRHTSDGECISRLFTRARKNAPCVVVLEDLDSLITDYNRSVFLNELDGFHANEGLILIASTNHPEKLDRSILDRPSRFDRKFHFHLPALAERRAYLSKWNETVKPSLRLTGGGIEQLAERSNGFSFAYLKELMLASMMAWVNLGPGASMDEVARAQLQTLRREMKSADDVLPSIAGNRRISLAPDALEAELNR